MLPDFPDLKKDLSDRLSEFLEARVAFHLGPLSRIRRVSIFEGRGDRRFTRSSGETETFTMQQVRGEFSIPTKELPTTTLDTILAKIDNAAQQIARQMAENIYQTISEAVERVGNTIDAKGQKPSAELILETLAKIQVDFDRDGKPRMPELHIHPTLEEATKLAFEELENNPELKKQFKQTMEEKREEWRAREASRILVG